MKTDLIQHIHAQAKTEEFYVIKTNYANDIVG